MKPAGDEKIRVGQWRENAAAGGLAAGGDCLNGENDQVDRSACSMLRNNPYSQERFQLALKRLTDIVLAGCGLLVLSPLMLLAALAIKLDTKGPALFKQKRFGRHGKFFEIYKFRSMAVGTPQVATDKMASLPSTVTRVGKILRATSIDELPQLINVLSGSMSIVGPRPALYNQVELNSMRQQAGVLEAAPGITGWAQVNGRDELPDDAKVAFDKWYCDNWCYALDLQIIIKTVSAVLSRRGVR